MDREMMFALALSLFGTAIASAYYFGSPPVTEKQIYAPEDIRYSLQQAELKALDKAKKKKVHAPAADAPTNDTTADEPAEASLSDHPPVEAPPLE